MIIAVTGGIGSGKSVVCRILETMGAIVYDCDTRAKALMDSDPAIKQAIVEQISPTAISKDGEIDRKALAAIVFSDREKLDILNKISHAAVRADILRWAQDHASEPRLFVETAILYQSGLDKIVDEVWEVSAPEEARIQRVCLRNNITHAEVRARIESQRYEPETPHERVRIIVNDGMLSILAQIHQLLRF